MTIVSGRRGQPRSLRPEEIDELLTGDHLCRLATLDQDGFPHVTPLWFLWAEGCFLMTSLPGKPHVARLQQNPRAGLVIDVEAAQQLDGERPNRQVRITGHALLEPDAGGEWTRRITEKYVVGTAQLASAQRRATQERVVVRIQPISQVAVASR